jgi:multiple sugar transport system permease protein
MPLSRNTQHTIAAAGFLLPNILGFLCLTVFPLVLSLFMAFTNWDLTLHNIFRDAPLKFVGLENFQRMFTEPDFWRFLGNTLFMMIRIPFSIAGSLLLAVLLTRKLRLGQGRTLLWVLVIPAITAAGIFLMSVSGFGMTGMTMLLLMLAAGILAGGLAGGAVLYRTLFFLPSFTAGAAVFILWTKLYNPNTGPINLALQGPLQSLTYAVRSSSPWVTQAIGVIFLGLMVLIAWLVFSKLRKQWLDGDVGLAACILPTILILLPAWTGFSVLGGGFHWIMLAVPTALLAQTIWMRGPRPFRCSSSTGSGSAFMLAGGAMVGMWFLLGLGMVALGLLARARQGVIEPPLWLADYHWAKPAIMLMGFWITLGSNNMLLYIAGLSNIPPELYEAADIDGAGPLDRFWNVTWPQLAPTTFFIVIMSVIIGLKSGFEQARVMTNGGPDGATTTMSYYIYTEGFEIGRLGYASCVAWTLFLMIFSVTLFNWKFGNRYVNE